MSEDDNREAAARLGLKPADRLPDIFLEAVRPLKSGDIAPSLLRTGAGFHVLKLIERAEGGAFRVDADARAPHPAAPVGAAERSGGESRGWPTSSARSKPARAASKTWRASISLDGSAPAGGDLGWASPGQYVPEFEAGDEPAAHSAASPSRSSRASACT